MIIVNADILLGITILLLTLVAIRTIYLKKVATEREHKLMAATDLLESAKMELEKLRDVERRFQTFKADLNQAELSTKIQQPRLNTLQTTESHQAPERYHYIHSLTKKGINSSDIASILAISDHEANQLVTLANLSRN